MAHRQLSDDEVIAALERQFDTDASLLRRAVLGVGRWIWGGLVAMGSVWHPTAGIGLAALRNNDAGRGWR